MSVDSISANGQGLDPMRAQIAGVIKQAAASTGASFEYLVTAAKIESNLQPNAAASTSSARGLYQFIEQTWLGMVKGAGAAFGFGKFADAITRDSSGAYAVADPATRQQILNLRDDPAANAAMAGALTQSNNSQLTSAIGRRPTDAELYIAHFLGVGGAARLIAANQTTPQASAADMFPGAAAATRSIFYDGNNDPRTVAAVYADLTQRYAAAANSITARSAVALVGPADGTSTAGVPAPYLSAMPQVPSAQAQPPLSIASRASENAAALTDDGAMFRSLFQVGDRPDPISPAVRALWGAGQNQSAPSLTPEIKLKPPSPLDLFSDRDGTFSG
jgi:hypothetical protein